MHRIETRKKIIKCNCLKKVKPEKIVMRYRCLFMIENVCTKHFLGYCSHCSKIIIMQTGLQISVNTTIFVLQTGVAENQKCILSAGKKLHFQALIIKFLLIPRISFAPAKIATKEKWKLKKAHCVLAVFQL